MAKNLFFWISMLLVLGFVSVFFINYYFLTHGKNEITVANITSVAPTNNGVRSVDYEYNCNGAVYEGGFIIPDLQKWAKGQKIYVLYSTIKPSASFPLLYIQYPCRHTINPDTVKVPEKAFHGGPARYYHKFILHNQRDK